MNSQGRLSYRAQEKLPHRSSRKRSCHFSDYSDDLVELTRDSTASHVCKPAEENSSGSLKGLKEAGFQNQDCFITEPDIGVMRSRHSTGPGSSSSSSKASWKMCSPSQRPSIPQTASDTLKKRSFPGSTTASDSFRKTRTKLSWIPRPIVVNETSALSSNRVLASMTQSQGHQNSRGAFISAHRPLSFGTGTTSSTINQPSCSTSATNDISESEDIPFRSSGPSALNKSGDNSYLRNFPRLLKAYKGSDAVEHSSGVDRQSMAPGVETSPETLGYHNLVEGSSQINLGCNAMLPQMKTTPSVVYHAHVLPSIETTGKQTNTNLEETVEMVRVFDLQPSYEDDPEFPGEEHHNMSWTPTSSPGSPSTAKDHLQFMHEIPTIRKQNTNNQPDIEVHETVDNEVDELTQRQINKKPLRFKSKRVADDSLRSMNNSLVTGNSSSVKNTNIEVYEIVDDNDAENAVLAQANGKGSPNTQSRKASRSTISISNHEREVIDLDASIHHQSRKKAGDYAPNTDNMKRQRIGNVIDLDPEDIEQGIEDALNAVEEADEARFDRGKIRVPYRNPRIELPLQELDTFEHSKGRFQYGWTYELHDGSFLLVHKIVQNLQTDDVMLRGLRLKRAREVHGYFPPKLNEVVFLIDIDKDDPRAAMEQGVYEVPIYQVLKRRQLLITNVPFPGHRFRHDDWNDSPDVAENAHLVARWKFVRVFPTAVERFILAGGSKIDQMAQAIRENEFEGMISMSDKQLRSNWRGKTVLGGAYRPTVDPPQEAGVYYSHDREIKREVAPAKSRRSPRQTAIKDDEEYEAYDPQWLREVVNVNVLDEDTANKPITLDDFDDDKPRRKSRISMPVGIENAQEVKELSLEPSHKASIDLTEMSEERSQEKVASPQKTKRLPGQTYTFADGFCGAGGTTAGAQKAKLKVRIGFDCWAHAGTSWTANFPDAALYLMTANDFIHFVKEHNHDVKIDILHISPPCQFFSPAHTIEGQNDDANIAAFLCIEEAVTTFKPRIVTLEETAGLCLPLHFIWLCKLVNMFTSKGYSIRWKVCELFKWGLCQPRKRLVVIAACPGESVPEFPEYTHDEDGRNGLKPCTTVGDVLADIPVDAEDHNPGTIGMAPNGYIPCSPNGMLRRTIVCHGGQNCHPSRRKLTLREYAKFQGFSNEHKFRGASILKQIGNAVPSMVAETLFTSIRKHLEAEDGVEDREVIDIDDDPKDNDGNYDKKKREVINMDGYLKDEATVVSHVVTKKGKGRAIIID